MITAVSILVVEDDDILARNMGVAIEDRACHVVGPAATVAAASALVGTAVIDGAILDASLLDRNVTPVALALIDKGVPFVIHTGVGLPEELEAVFPQVSVIMKPTDPDDVVVQLLQQIERLRSASTGETPVSGDSEIRKHQVESIASALFEQFGEKAVILARRQSVGAAGDALIAWSAIIANLTDRSDRNSGATEIQMT